MAEKVGKLSGDSFLPLWVGGEELTSSKLNNALDSINKGNSHVGGVSQLRKPRTVHPSPSPNPDLVFRQESSDMPADGGRFPKYFANRPFRIVGVQAFLEDSPTAGTFTVVLNTDTEANPDTDLITYTDADVGDIIYLPSGEDGTVLNGESVNLKVTSSSDVIDFQLNVILRLV